MRAKDIQKILSERAIVQLREENLNHLWTETVDKISQETDARINAGQTSWAALEERVKKLEDPGPASEIKNELVGVVASIAKQDGILNQIEGRLNGVGARLTDTHNFHSEKAVDLKAKIARLQRFLIGLTSLMLLMLTIFGFQTLRQPGKNMEIESLLKNQRQLEQKINDLSSMLEQQLQRMEAVDSLSQTNMGAIIKLRDWFEQYTRQRR